MLDILKLADFSISSVMGIGPKVVNAESSWPVGPDGKKLKPCCACPETKKVRDECIIERGEAECSELIEAHKACMRKLGFKI